MQKWRLLLRPSHRVLEEQEVDTPHFVMSVTITLPPAHQKLITPVAVHVSNGTHSKGPLGEGLIPGLEGHKAGNADVTLGGDVVACEDGLGPVFVSAGSNVLGQPRSLNYTHTYSIKHIHHMDLPVVLQVDELNGPLEWPCQR